MENKTCRNCGAKLIEKQTKRTAAQLKKPHYYTAYYSCTRSNKFYHDEKFKVENKLHPSLFSSLDKPQPNKILRAQRITNAYDVEIWTDGACVYNGTPRARAAWAFVAGKVEIGGRVEGKQTNNVAEGL